MRNFFREYFNYSSREIRSLYYLLILLLLSIIIRSVVARLNPEVYYPDNEILSKNQTFIDKLKFEDQKVISITEPIVELLPEYFYFDPNTIDVSGLKKLGFGDRVISNISKYKDKGGRFIKPDDLKIIYGLTDEKFIEVENWIKIESVNNSEEDIEITKYNNSLSEPEDTFELNSLGYRELLNIIGRDSLLAGRILGYKKLLGGYYSMSQLSEVYGMNDSTFNSLSKLIIIDRAQISTLSLNTSNYSELLRHPYLDKNHVEIIMKFREFRNSEIDIYEFISNQLLPDSIIAIVRPYLAN